MSGMARIKLPNVTTDRSGGITRYYFRRVGAPKVRLPGAPGSADFMAAYQAARKAAGLDTAPGKNAPGTLGAAITAYFASAAFVRLSPERRATTRRRLDAIAAESGSRRLKDIRYADLVASRDRRAERPAAANEFVKMIRAVFAHAEEIGLIATNPAAALKQLRTRTDGHHVATLDDLRTYLATHPPGTMAHLAFCLLLFTGARPVDAICIGRQHIQGERLVFRPGKTAGSSGVSVNVPIAGMLREAIDQAGGRMTLLETEHGKPFRTAKSFGNRVKKWWIAAGVPQASAYSFRKGGATIAGNEGTSDLALMAAFGWTNSKTASIYTRTADRSRLAGNAVAAIERGVAGTEIVPSAAPIVPRKEKRK